ncbi:class I SAM-dependent methyltransferase [Shewanella sp. AS1]|uniref:DUF938 domain-containing protein n=1 Tax=Shewanella sp. AS1 TaxID=2907626 RepID=UPI001F1A806B|nr:DUF938 domain-containing protein [Shewanella sp. AS1]MCE9678583.1 class I SAM-dependent methyltransferase [Shewanella sp. AS1]
MDPSELPYSQSCENNKHPILSVLSTSFSRCKQVLEIGSGTGQHATFFANHLPHLIWQPSDQGIYIQPLTKRIAFEGGDNLNAPLTLEVSQSWPCDHLNLDGIFSANTLHIMSMHHVDAFFAGVKQHLSPEGKCCIYGPFNYNKQYTSESNHQFDIWLKQRDKNSGIRDIEWIIQLASAAGLELAADHEMPANNRLLEFYKRA